jgi:hypothetical protein
MPTAGYSGTPLAKKLGIKPGFIVATINQPDDFQTLLDPLPEDVAFRDSLRGSPDVVVAFFSELSKLKARLPALARAIYPAASLWLAWPKKASGVETDITGNDVRELGLAAGVVDVKVAAISDVWSGHKFVHRVENR